MNKSSQTSEGRSQYVTFDIGSARFALDLTNVQEINRSFNLTRVPHAPEYVLGVTNLRGDVVTILDLRIILEVEQQQPNSQDRNLIVNYQGELIGLSVDQVSDIMTLDASELSPPPTNLQGVPRKLVQSVYHSPTTLVMILDIDEMFVACSQLIDRSRGDSRLTAV